MKFLVSLSILLLLMTATVRSHLLSLSDEENQDDWIDPTDMLNYDMLGQRMKSKPESVDGSSEKGGKKSVGEVDKMENVPQQQSAPSDCKEFQSNVTQLQKALDKCNKTVFNLTTQVEKCPKLRQELFFQQYIRFLLTKFKKFSNSIDGHYNSVVTMTATDYEFLQNYADKEFGSVQEVHSILTSMFCNVRWSSASVDIDDEENELLEMVKEYLWIFGQIILVLYAAILFVRLFHHHFHFWFFSKLLIVCLILSIPWNWYYLYKKEVAKRLAQMHKNMSESCSRNTHWWSSFFSIFSHTDECTRYHETVHVDPLWEVSPSKAFAMTISKFLLEPAEHIGEAVKQLILATFDGLPIHLALPAFGFLLLLTILLFFGLTGFRIRTLFFNIEPHRPNIQALEGDRRTLEAQNETLQQRIAQLEEELAQERNRNLQLPGPGGDPMPMPQLEVNRPENAALIGPVHEAVEPMDIEHEDRYPIPVQEENEPIDQDDEFEVIND